MRGPDESDRFSTGWVLDLEKEYRRSKGRSPLQPGHWDPDPDQFQLPPLEPRLDDAVRGGLHRYHFTEDLHSAKDDLAAFLSVDRDSGLSFSVEPTNVSIQSTSTQALFQLLLALRQAGAGKAVVCTPVYFSIWECCRLLGYEVKFFDTAIRDGGASQAQALTDFVADSCPDVVVISFPHYPTGVSWPVGFVERLYTTCRAIGATLVVDATHAGLEWGDSARLSGEHVDEADGFAVVQSPAKAFFLNGARFAHVVAKKALVQRIEDNVHVTSGAVSVLQWEIAKALYAARRKELEDPPAIGAGYLGVLEANKARLRENHSRLSAGFRGTEARLCPSSSSVFTMVDFPRLDSEWNTERAFLRDLLFTRDTLAFLGGCYRASSTLNPLAARLTLSSPPAVLLEGMRRLCETEAVMASGRQGVRPAAPLR